MNKQCYIYLFIGLISGWLITTSLFSPTQGYPRLMGMMGFQNGTTNIDRHFIEQMIPHHEDAIIMAEVALEKSKRPEIKTLAQNIITSQGDEIVQLSQWYGDWYGQTVPSGSIQMDAHGMMTGSDGMHMGLLGNEVDLAAFNSATDIDKEFIRQMIPHHQMAIMMASMLENSTENAEMRQLAKNITSAQTKEIADMRSWYSDWYK